MMEESQKGIKKILSSERIFFLYFFLFFFCPILKAEIWPICIASIPFFSKSRREFAYILIRTPMPTWYEYGFGYFLVEINVIDQSGVLCNNFHPYPCNHQMRCDEATKIRDHRLWRVDKKVELRTLFFPNHYNNSNHHNESSCWRILNDGEPPYVSKKPFNLMLSARHRST